MRLLTNAAVGFPFVGAAPAPGPTSLHSGSIPRLSKRRVLLPRSPARLNQVDGCLYEMFPNAISRRYRAGDVLSETAVVAVRRLRMHTR